MTFIKLVHIHKLVYSRRINKSKLIDDSWNYCEANGCHASEKPFFFRTLSLIYNKSPLFCRLIPQSLAYSCYTELDTARSQFKCRKLNTKHTVVFPICWSEISVVESSISNYYSDNFFTPASFHWFCL